MTAVEGERTGGRGNARPRPQERGSRADGHGGGEVSRVRSRWGADDGLYARRERREQVGDDVHSSGATVRAGPPNDWVPCFLTGFVRPGREGRSAVDLRVGAASQLGQSETGVLERRTTARAVDA